MKIKSITGSKSWLFAAGMITALCITVFATGQQDAPRGGNANEVGEPLTRGTIHEAFGQPVAFDPKPGLTVAKGPPAAVEEVPPEEKPVGDNVAWIPGYWGWDEERRDFIWVSGFWRVMPPDRQWVPGYWKQASDGYQWIAGFWMPATQQDIQYLPDPPQSLEAGPSTQPPGADYVWSPGYWGWRETAYAWYPGFWLQLRPDWIWCPAHYVWTPNGVVFINGYWDYTLSHRGLLFAPVFFRDTAIVARRNFVFSPTIAISLGGLVDSLFCWPRYHHYCFGDYFAATSVQAGIYPWVSFNTTRVGWDPLFSHYNVVYARRDPQWRERLVTDYRFRQEHQEARPARTFAAQQQQATAGAGGTRPVVLAQPLKEAVQAKSTGLKFERVDMQHRQSLAQQARGLQQIQEHRAKTEVKAAAGRPAVPEGGRPGTQDSGKVGKPDTGRPGTTEKPANQPSGSTLPKSPVSARPEAKPIHGAPVPPPPKQPAPTHHDDRKPGDPSRAAPPAGREPGKPPAAQPPPREPPPAQQPPPKTEGGKPPPKEKEKDKDGKPPKDKDKDKDGGRNRGSGD
jgi:hypothetical protein